MRVTLTGVTGFMGARLAAELTTAGHELRVLGRRRPSQLPSSTEFFAWDSNVGEPPAESLQGSDAVVNLAGEPVAQRWTPEVRRRIRDSRVTGTRHLVNALSTIARPRSAAFFMLSAHALPITLTARAWVASSKT